MSDTIEIYDSTLRDGAQAEGITYSLEDKLLIARRLDQLGVHYIEGGWPNPTNPKDLSFFREAAKLNLRARVTRLWQHPPGRPPPRGRRDPQHPAAGRDPKRLHLWQELDPARGSSPAHPPR